MVNILLTAPAFAMFETACDIPASSRYRERIAHRYYKPGSYATIGEPTDGIVPSTLRMSTAIWVTPDGFTRQEQRTNSGFTFTEIVTREERITFVDPSPWGLRREPRDDNPFTRTFERIFGLRYPHEALAVLNPFLMMWEYTCDRNSVRRSTYLDHPVTTVRYTHRPDVHIQASDDPERLGSMDVEVMLADDLPLLLGWDALDGDTTFARTRMTHLELDASFDEAVLFTPESAREHFRPDR